MPQGVVPFVAVDYLNSGLLPGLPGGERVVTESGGWVVSAHDYYPFGLEMIDPLTGPPGESRMRFTGHERNEMTSADYMKARYKLSTCVSFAGPDSACDVSFTRPSSWNKYSYVRNNAVRYVDPAGNDAWEFESDWGEITLTSSVWDVGPFRISLSYGPLDSNLICDASGSEARAV